MIERQIRRLDDRRKALLDELASVRPEDLAVRPAAGKWSILEIVEHLVVAEGVVFLDFPPVADLKARRRRWKHRFAYLVVFFVLRFGVRVQTPSPKMNPEGGRSLAELRRRWDENLARLRSYAAELDRGALRRALFRHPAVGPITLAQALTLDLLHLEVHSRQIRRLRDRGDR